MRKRNLQSFLLKGIDRGSQSVNNITFFIYSEAFANNERYNILTLDTFLSETSPTCANCCYILCFNVMYVYICLFLFIVDYCHHPTSAQIDDSPSTNGDTTFIWTSSTVFTCLCQDSEVTRVQRMCRQHSVTIYCTTRDVENESFIRMKTNHHQIYFCQAKQNSFNYSFFA